MKVLVTGIDGFAGSHLSRALLASGKGAVEGLVWNEAAARKNPDVSADIPLYEADICDPERVLAVVRASRPDRLYHLAGQAYVPNAIKDPYSTLDINIMGGIHILEAVRKVVPECRVLVVSSGEVYGIVEPDRLPIDESFPIDPKNLYASSKAALDMIVQQYRAAFSLNVVLTRSFNHFGPGQSELFAGSWFGKQIIGAKLGLHDPIIRVGNLENKRDMTDVRDVVSAYVALTEKVFDHTVFNVCSGRALSMSEILSELIRLSGIEVEVVQDPERFRVGDNPIMIGNPTRLMNATGWKPLIPLEKTLLDILAYWEHRLSK